jgi:hypothetical protein
LAWQEEEPARHRQGSWPDRKRGWLVRERRIGLPGKGKGLAGRAGFLCCVILVQKS